MTQVYPEAEKVSNELDMSRLNFGFRMLSAQEVQNGAIQNGGTAESSVNVTVFCGGGRSM